MACEDDVAVSASTRADAFATPSAPVPVNESRPGVLAGARPLSLSKVTNSADASGKPVDGTSSSGAAMPPATAVTPPGMTGAMIVRNGTTSIEVDSLDTAIARVRTLALRVNGYIANTTVQGGRDQLRTASLELKVPSERFDDAITGLSPIGKVEAVNVNAEDVGEEYVDIEARVQNAHKLEARIIDLLANRDGKLNDVLSVEHELARVREDIERYEGRMRYLRTRASISTLTIAVHERAPVIVPVAGDGPILVAFREAWETLVNLTARFIASLGLLIPLGLLVCLGWLGVRRWVVPVLTPAAAAAPKAEGVIPSVSEGP